MSKGSRSRVTDQQRYGENHDRIDWGKTAEEAPEDEELARIAGYLDEFDWGETDPEFSAAMIALESRLRLWVTQHAAKIHCAVLGVHDGSWRFIVMRKAVKYDGDFTDELTEFDRQIALDPELQKVKLDCLALPHTREESIDHFLQPLPRLWFEPKGDTDD